MKYQNAEELYKIFAVMIEKVKKDQELTNKLVASNLVVALKIPNIEGLITMELKGEINVTFGATDIKPDVTSIQNDEIFNKFWQGKVNIMLAMTKGQIRVQGAATQMLKLLPTLSPVYKLYAEALKDADRVDLIA
jgi:putative sterol carrier protein